MAEERIDSYVDRAGVQRDTKFIVDELNIVYDTFKKVEGIKVDFRGLSGLAGITPGMQQAKVVADSLAEATRVVTERIAQLNGSSKEFTQVLLAQTKAQKESAQAALITAKAANEAAKAKDRENKSTQDSSRAKAAEKNLLDDAINDYLQLSRAYNEAALKAKNYVLRLGEGHPIAVQAVKDANDLGNILKKLDASVGQNQRNVGNYKSGFDGLGFSFTQVARELPSLAVNFQQFALAISNNLPFVADQIAQTKREIAALRAEGKEAPSLFRQIGRSILSFQVALSIGITLFTLFAGQIKDWVTGLFSGNQAMDEARRSQEALNEAYKEAASEVTRVKTQISELKTQIQLAKDGLVSKNDVLDEYNKTIGKTTGQVKSLDEAEKELVKNADAIIQITLLKAAAQQIASKAAAKAVEVEIDNRKKIVSAVGQAKDGGAIIDTEGQLTDYDAFLAKINDKTTLSRRLRQRDARTEEVNFLQKLSDDLLKEAANLSKAFGFDFFGSTKGGSGSGKDLAEQRRRILYEISKIEQEAIAEGAKAILEDERASFFDRLTAFDTYVEARNKMVDDEAEFEKGKKGVTSDEILLIEAQKWKAQLDLARESVKLLDKIEFDDRLGSARAFLRDRYEAFRKAYKEEVDLFEDMQKSIEKSAKEYEKRLRDASKADLKARQDTYKEYVDERKRLEKELAEELIALGADLLKAGLEREKNAIQERIDLLEQQRQKDIEFINQTVTSRQDAADQIAIVEARANAEREQLQRRQRQIEQEQARFDKAASIASIIQKTAEAIIGFLAKPGGIPGTVLSVLAGAIGAAQLARVIATPIPRYKFGKDLRDHYEGPAIVGDGGKKEMIVRESGDVEITPDTPTLTHVGKRDIIYPDAAKVTDVAMAMANEKARGVTTIRVAADNGSVSEIKAMHKGIVKAISRIPQPIIKAENVLSRRIRHGDNSNTYLNQNLQS